MQAPTHAAFGLVFVILAGTVVGILLTPAVALFVCLGALLPDIDTPTSLIGTACRPLSRVLERRFGHRTLTHSLLGLALFTLPVLPLGLLDLHWPLAFGLGYLSHLLVDCANKSGAPLFYPSRLRAVLPWREEQRIQVGSGREMVLFVVLDPATAKIHTAGTGREAHLYPYGIRAHRGRPIAVRTRPVALTQQLLTELLRHVPPDGESYLQGTVKLGETPVVRPDPEQYEVLKPGLHELELRFARARDLQDPAVADLFVLSGLVLVQTIVSAEAGSPPPGVSSTETALRPFDDVTQLFIAHLVDPARELLVREGEQVLRGQLLARLTSRDPELERKRRQAEAALEEKEAERALQETKLEQARALGAVGLAAPAAVEREAVRLRRAQEAVAQARRALERLAGEVRRSTEVSSPVDGRVLTIRLHVIHGSESTAVLRLLYRKSEARD